MKRRALVAALFVAAAVVVGLVAREHLALDRLAARELELRAAIEARPWVAFTVGFFIYTAVSFFPGTSGKSIVCGWFYGFWQALAMVTVALTLAGLGGFMISRYLLADWVRRRFSGAVRVANRKLDQDGVFYLLTVRMLHVPYTLVNYVTGVSGVPAAVFAWTTLIGLIPSTAIFVGVGASLPTLREVQRHGASRLLEPNLLLALVVMGALPWAIRWLLRRSGLLRPGPPAADSRGHS